MNICNTILNYWFGCLSDKTETDNNSNTVKRWFTKSVATDNKIKDKFEDDLILAKEGQYSDWKLCLQNILKLKNILLHVINGY